MDANDVRDIRTTSEAADWWVDLERGDMSRARREEFVDWLRESPTHVAELLRVARVHGALENFRLWDHIPTGTAVPQVLLQLARAPARIESGARQRTTRIIRTALSAAAACAAVVIGWMLLPGEEARLLQTGRGESHEIALEDGSHIQLAPETRLHVELGDHERAIRLSGGAALFRVAKDAHRPFIVYFDGASARAVGTQFGVDVRNDGTVVTVSEGRVSVRPSILPRAAGSRESGSTASSEHAAAATETLLSANEQLTVLPSGKLQASRAVDSERELSWSKGRLTFENEAVSSVIERFNRYNMIQIDVTDAEIAQRSVSGTFDAYDPNAFVAFVGATIPIAVTRTADNIVVKKADPAP